MTKVFFFLTLAFTVIACREKATEVVPKVTEETANCAAGFARDRVIVTSATLVNLKHPFSENFKRIKHHYAIFSDASVGEPHVLTYIVKQHSRRVRLNYYFIGDQPLVIEKQVLNRIDTLTDYLPYLLDSLYLLEYYYLLDTCCVKEQYSYGCLNGGSMGIDEGPCQRELDLLRKLTGK